MTGDCDKSLEVRVAKLETALKYQTKAQERALDLQAREYDRRLKGLNNEAGRILQVQQQCVSKDVYDLKIKELEKMSRPVPWIVALISLVAATAAALLVRWLSP